jgi:hypothetical protein
MVSAVVDVKLEYDYFGLICPPKEILEVVPRN